MGRFRFRCISVQNNLPLEAEVFLENRSRGFTPSIPGGWLELNDASDGPVGWYAFLWNARVAKGVALGGDFEILVDENSRSIEMRESDFDLDQGNPPPAPRI